MKNNNGTICEILHHNKIQGNFGIQYNGLGELNPFPSSKGLNFSQQTTKNDLWPKLPSKKTSIMEEIIEENTEWNSSDFSNTENNYKYDRRNFELNISYMKKEFF